MAPFAFQIKSCLPSFLGGRKKEKYECQECQEAVRGGVQDQQQSCKCHKGYTGSTYKNEYNTFIVNRDPRIEPKESRPQFVPFNNSSLGGNDNNNGEREWGRFLSGRSFGSDISQHPSELRKTRDSGSWEDGREEFWYDARGEERAGGGVFPQK